VVTFLSWAAEPEADDRKLMGAKWIAVLSLVSQAGAGQAGRTLRQMAPHCAS